ncbi:YtpI family protein [Ferviditalea candida]|uniref:YtpI family protein n=1 Tax=Ferviditalea candida TaxID=3108399 RepID=A0ABU5ZDG7_9BACL|nr:YtpI family protein [Paenibacillaceae bacterium T2]
MDLLRNILYLVIGISLGFSIYYSFKHRRESDPVRRSLSASKMNISLGTMLVSLSVFQFFWFTPSNTRIIIGLLFFLLGLFNLFSGLRSHTYFSKHPDMQSTKKGG